MGLLHLRGVRELALPDSKLRLAYQLDVRRIGL